MGANQAVRSTPLVVDKPEKIGPALALVVVQDDQGRDQILGQAWLAAPNRLVTCGHVVDAYIQNPRALSLQFPASGKSYPVESIRLHPSFVRQPDGLVKFDVALLCVQLAPPDSLAPPLPFSYENTLTTNQTLWTIRYPAHLGQLSAAMQPLSQNGKFLGLLRKHDSFHLLHDVALAPGDSGAAICDARGVVALHCGDTATIPGLNLPTTSIRLALWVDALRELDLSETRKTYLNRTSRVVSAVLTFFLMFAIAFGAGSALLTKPTPAPKPFIQPDMLPLLIKFNKAPNAYRKGEAVEITLDAVTPIFPFVFVADKTGLLAKIYPGGPKPQKLDGSTTIDQSHHSMDVDRPVQLEASGEPVKLYVLAVKADDADASLWAAEFIKPNEIYDKATGSLIVSEKDLLTRINDFEKRHPALVSLTKIDMPAAKEK